LKRRELRFPRDFGSHPDFAIEWWYVTGHASSGSRQFGFQITFFRSRVQATQSMSSAFAAKQLIFAHAGITDVQGKKLWHDQQIARASGAPPIDLASASELDTRLRLRDWSLQRDSVAIPDSGKAPINVGEAQRSRYRAQVANNDFALNLQFTPTQSVLLQGDHGLSRKGPQEGQASYYYSVPQLDVAGDITLQGKQFHLDASPTAAAWLDHEWSQELLHPQAVGWDWIGINMLDGSALTAYQLRDKMGHALWQGGSFRGPAKGAEPQVFDDGDVQFQPVRYWSSTVTQAKYPVQWMVHIKRFAKITSPGQEPGRSSHAAGELADFYTVKAVIDNQELDSRASTGTVYWEGLTELFDGQGQMVGRGYLEMTGYAGALRL
jgi:predicted secreted hydrolase